MHRGLYAALALTLAASTFGYGAPIADDLATVPGVAYESYLVRWWGAPYSEMDRPIYRITRFDTGMLQVRYGIVPGRTLEDYTMPYFPIRSFLSFVDAPAELAQQVRLRYRDDAEQQSLGFSPRSGVELAGRRGQLFVKIRNRSLAAPEDVTTVHNPGYRETNPLAFEQTFALRKDGPGALVRCMLSNAGDTVLRDVAATLTFEQRFTWSRFGAGAGGRFSPLRAPAQGEATAFYAWSGGMNRGYMIAAGSGTRLEYELLPESNHWRVQIHADVGTLEPGASAAFAFSIEALREPPARMEAPPGTSGVSALDFTRYQPSGFKTAPISREDRVRISDMLADVERPKVRGMNPRAGHPQKLDDINLLRDWGGNLVIADLSDPDETAGVIAYGHALGMEMLLTGLGTFRDGPPAFDAYYASPRAPEELPDAHGQDEDHYYWYAIAPSRSFEADTGKPKALAEHDEMVEYWARCFADKWHSVRQAVAEFAPDAGVWFYAPFPGVAYVDPLDSYPLFLHTLVRHIGGGLTVFPFYYGIEYDQAEYMMALWKAAGAERAVFLPMRDFMTRPSQFVRAITAARRGGADGTCGFSFAIGAAPPDNQWQWKAVMLGAWANFPTPELDAFFLIEEPAELVELLAAPDLRLRVVLDTGGLDTADHAATLHEQLPHAVLDTGEPDGDDVTIIIAGTPPQDENSGILRAPGSLWEQRKGFVHMYGRQVRVSGADDSARDSAWDLLLRLAELARAENRLRELD